MPSLPPVPPLVLVLPLALLLPGCSWFSASIALALRLPQPPEHWRRAFPELRCEWCCPQAALPPAGPWDAAGAGAAGSLRLPPRAHWPGRASPLARGQRLAPAGALFPLDLGPGGGALELSWERGPLAEVLRRLAVAGVEVGRVNAPRLADEMLEASGGDPWRLDLSLAAQALARGGFRVTDLRLLPARDLELALPAGGWFLEAPLHPAQCSAPGQALLLPAVPLGPHLLFAAELPGGFDLLVGEREILLLPLSP